MNAAVSPAALVRRGSPSAAPDHRLRTVSWKCQCFLGARCHRPMAGDGLGELSGEVLALPVARLQRSIGIYRFAKRIDSKNFALLWGGRRGNSPLLLYRRVTAYTAVHLNTASRIDAHESAADATLAPRFPGRCS